MCVCGGVLTSSKKVAPIEFLSVKIFKMKMKMLKANTMRFVPQPQPERIVRPAIATRQSCRRKREEDSERWESS